MSNISHRTFELAMLGPLGRLVYLYSSRCMAVARGFCAKETKSP